jgi:hypothetical protein
MLKELVVGEGDGRLVAMNQSLIFPCTAASMMSG